MCVGPLIFTKKQNQSVVNANMDILGRDLSLEGIRIAG